jgi:hypothetical protein
MSDEFQVITKEAALKYLWAVVETTPKFIKTLEGNPAGKRISNTCWGELRQAQTTIQCMSDYEVGCYYKFERRTSGDDTSPDYIIVKLEAVGIQNNRVCSRFRTLAASKVKVGWHEAQDEIIRDFDSCDYPADSKMTIDTKDLPLYLNCEFRGTLFEELTKGVSK